MKRLLIILLTLISAAYIFPIHALAYSDEETQSIAENAGADDITNPYLSSDELSGDKNINIFEKVIEIITDSLSNSGPDVLKAFGGILGILILCCAMSAMKFGGEALDSAISYISVLALSGVTYSVLYKLFITVIASMEALTIAMSSLMPVMASLFVSGGAIASGAASNAALTLFLTVLNTICTKIILPLLQISFALSITSAMPSCVNLSGICNLIKNTATVILSFIFSLLSFVLYFQTAVATAGDNLVTRSVKFASGVFVPVIGGMLGEATRTVVASVSLIKGTVGAAGIVIIFSIIIPPLITVIISKLLILVCSVIGKTIGCDRESALLYDLGGILNILLALVAGAGVVCIIAFAVFVKTGVTA